MKKNILHVGPLPPPVGGMSVFLQQLYNFESNQFHFQFFNVFPKKNTKIRKLFYNLFVFLKFFFVLLLRKPELVHIHTAAYRSFTRSRYFVTIATLLNRKVVLHIHSGKFIEYYHSLPPKSRDRFQKTLRHCDRIVCLSPIWKNAFAEAFSIEENHFVVIPNAIFVEPFTHIRPLDPREGKAVLFVGKVGENKGILDLVEVAKRMKDSEVKFLIMGSGPLEEHVKQEVKAHNLNIDLLGSLTGEEKMSYFEKANIFILPSYFEALGLSNLEGMAAGHVVLTTNVGAIPDIIHEGEEGFLLQPGDIEGFVQLIEELDVETIEQMSHHNKRKAWDYDFSELNKKLNEFYKSIL